MHKDKPEKLSDEVNIDNLKRKSVRGGMVTMLGQALTITIQLTSTVVLARLLSPEDYGVIAMVMAVTAFAGLFREMGLSTAAIQKKDLTRGQQSNLFWLNVVMGCVLTLLVAVGSPLVAQFYNKPELVSVTTVLSFNFLICSLATQHNAMLVRNMQFGRKSVATISGALVTLVVAVVLALQGRGYWALVWGTLVGSVITTVLTLALAPFHPSRPSRGQGIREMLGFGANVTAFNFVNYFHRNLDTILVGRYWGAESLGYYSRAYQLLMFPITAIREPINSVAFPAMSQLQNKPEEFRQYYRGLTLLLSHMTMPLVAFLLLYSELIVELTLGKQWLAAAPIFSVLAITAFIQTPYTLVGIVQLSLGRGKRYLQLGFMSAIVTSAGFCIGLKWGPIGIATAYAVTTYILVIPTQIWGFKGTSLALGDFFSSIYRPCLAALLAGVISFLFDKSYVLGGHILLIITAHAFIYGMSYLIILACVPHGLSDLKRVRDLFRLAIGTKVG